MNQEQATSTGSLAQPRASSLPRREWDAVAAIIAACVGLLALLVSGYTAYIQRQQVRAQVWPYLQFDFSNVLAHLEWRNQGVGPAIVRTIQVLLDGKPQHDWRELDKTLGLEALHYQTSSLNGMVLTPGQTTEWVKFQNTEDFIRFQNAAKSRQFRYKVCYCSTLNDCWMLDSELSKRQPLDRCPKLPDSAQFND